MNSTLEKIEEISNKYYQFARGRKRIKHFIPGTGKQELICRRYIPNRKINLGKTSSFFIASSSWGIPLRIIFKAKHARILFIPASMEYKRNEDTIDTRDYYMEGTYKNSALLAERLPESLDDLQEEFTNNLGITGSLSASDHHELRMRRSCAPPEDKSQRKIVLQSLLKWSKGRKGRKTLLRFLRQGIMAASPGNRKTICTLVHTYCSYYLLDVGREDESRINDEEDFWSELGYGADSCARAAEALLWPGEDKE